MADARVSRPFAERFDRLTLWGMALGVALLLQPWWAAGFQVGFFVTLAATVLQIVASHLPRRAKV
jgi:hypothetical protein